jgi:hypothetical protein
MKAITISNLAVVIFCSSSLTSCVVVTGLDPAEKLAEKIETKAQELRKSNATRLAFDFIPSEFKLKRITYQDGEVTLSVHSNKKITGYSVIDVNRWFRTTYHNRFVLVEGSMRRTKKLGDPFQIVLKKSNDEIKWVAIE